MNRKQTDRMDVASQKVDDQRDRSSDERELESTHHGEEDPLDAKEIAARVRAAQARAKTLTTMTLAKAAVFPTKPISLLASEVQSLLKSGDDRGAWVRANQLRIELDLGSKAEWATVGMGMPSTLAELKTAMVKAGFSPDEINSLEWTPHGVAPIILARLAPDPPPPPGGNTGGNRRPGRPTGMSPETLAKYKHWSDLSDQGKSLVDIGRLHHEKTGKWPDGSTISKGIKAYKERQGSENT